jgi:hypothetical protein
VCRTFTIHGVTDDAIRLRLFPFSLLGREKKWFYVEKDAINTWDKCSKTFLAKFFPVGKPTPSEDHVWFEDRWMVASWCDE